MSLNMHMFRKCFWQCLLLAGPGVLAGTFVTACVAKYALPYNWNWELSMVLGSILSATDPVAVVALLKQLGASPILTTTITGESMLNDGTAIVVFTLFFRMYRDCTKVTSESYTGLEIAEFFARLALGGPALGLCFGWVSVWLIRKASHSTVETDMTVQIAVTLCCAYLSFYVAEAEAGVSGVLATVVAALVLAENAWPAVCNDETMHHVWYCGHAFSFYLTKHLHSLRFVSKTKALVR
jgi:NhaP-type Na+/H+ or K+/H+ antiporter